MLERGGNAVLGQTTAHLCGERGLIHVPARLGPLDLRAGLGGEALGDEGLEFDGSGRTVLGGLELVDDRADDTENGVTTVTDGLPVRRTANRGTEPVLTGADERATAATAVLGFELVELLDEPQAGLGEELLTTVTGDLRTSDGVGGERGGPGVEHLGLQTIEAGRTRVPEEPAAGDLERLVGERLQTRKLEGSLERVRTATRR